jgi:EAL domain-containing protein (putative c-di-GMP-specific phosphodiesterase class I)
MALDRPDTLIERPSARSAATLDRFVAFAFAAADMLLETTPEGRVTFAAGAFRAHLSVSPESLIGRDVAELVAPEDRMAFTTALSLLGARGRLAPTALRLANPACTPFAVSGLWLDTPGQTRHFCLSFAPMPAPFDARRATVHAAPALAREAEARLRSRGAATASTDPPLELNLLEVTGSQMTLLESRPELRQRLDAALAEGTGAGSFAASLAPGRYGLLQKAGSGLDLAELARSLEAALGSRLSLSAQAVPLDTEGLTGPQAVRGLRHALSTFTRAGRAGLKDAGFDGGLQGFIAGLASRGAVLRRAVARRQFWLEFQPIIGLRDGKLHHVEALLRPDPALFGPGTGPAEFVNLAEALGLTEGLDLAVAEQAAAAAAKAPCPIAFNISGLSAQSPSFRRSLLALLDRTPEAKGRLMVELTESAEVEQEKEAAETLGALRARGVPVCIDDFGAGAAAFRYLKAFPVDFVKVEGDYVRAAVREPRDRSFVAAMVDLSLAVGAKVIAERIETEEDAAMMRGLGVHLGQGWRFGRPGSLHDLAQPSTAGAGSRRDWSQEQWG